MYLEINDDEAQTIVDALSAMPYMKVYHLIPKIIDQANRSTNVDDKGNEEQYQPPHSGS